MATFKKTSEMKAQVLSLFDGMTEVEKALLCQFGPEWKEPEKLFSGLAVRPGTARYNLLAYASAMGGCIPAALKNSSFFFAKATGFPAPKYVRKSGFFKIITSDQISEMKKGDVLIKEHGPLFGLSSQLEAMMLDTLNEAGITVTTVGNLNLGFVMESEIGEEQFVDYLNKLDGSEVEVDGKKYMRVQITRYDSLDVRYQDGELEILQGLMPSVGREWYSFNGQPVPKFKAWMVSLNYLLSSKNAIVLKGRKAFMEEVFVDNVYVGKVHPMLAIEKKEKLGNLQLGVGSDYRVPMTEKGTKEMMEECARTLMDEGIPTFMHKSGAYLLCGDGARAAGVDIVHGLYHYWLEADKASKRAGGRHLHGVATAFSTSLEESGVGIRINGEVYRWEGVSHILMRVQSPLVVEGSGNFHYHPDLDNVDHPLFKQLWQERVYNHNFAAGQFGEAATRLGTYMPSVDTEVVKGSVLIGQKRVGVKDGDLVVSDKCYNVPHKASFTCKVLDTVTSFNKQTSNLDVKIKVAEYSNTAAEKYRGTGKGRGSSFCRNLVVKDANSNKLLYNARKPLGMPGESNCVQFLVSDEEGKTKLQLAEMAAHEVKGIVWSGDHWENEDLLNKWIEDNRLEVVVVRKNIEPTVYSILKQKFSSDDSFVFEDEFCTVTHKAQAWMGKVVDVVETPLTHTFVGKTSLFGEVISYLGIEHPNLYNLLMQGVVKNQVAIQELYGMVGDNSGMFDFAKDPDLSCFSHPLLLLEDGGTIVEYDKNNKFKVELDVMSPSMCEDLFNMTQEAWNVILSTDGISKPVYIKKITLPAGEIDLDSVRSINRALQEHAVGMAALGVDVSRVTFFGQSMAHTYRLDALARVSATSSHNISQNLIRILMHLGVESEMGAADDQLKRLRNSGGWESVMSRLQSMLQGAIRVIAIESNKVLAKAARTEEIAFQCRAATTIDAKCPIDTALIHPDLAEKFGLISGDTVLVGRNPMPKMGALKLCVNEFAPPNTLLMNAFAWHAFNEGDADGDSVFFLAISSDGDLVVPNF